MNFYTMAFWKKVIYGYAFFVTAAFFAAFEIFKISKGIWISDFWTHAAVVRELTGSLSHPNNPIIRSDTPHAFFSPYAVLIALAAKFWNLDPVTALTVFACINLFFFLLSFYLFCRFLFSSYHQPIAALALLFLLFFWGPNPPHWSGFYHFSGFHNVLPYPSTFAMNVSLLVLALLLKEKERHPAVFGVVVLLLSITFICHPTTAVFLFLAIAALYWGYRAFPVWKAALKSALLIVPALLLCLLWPYYNVMNLLVGNSADFNSDSKELYAGVMEKIWPVALLLPSLFWLWRNRVYWFLLLSTGLLLSVYAGAYAVKVYGFARLLSNVLMFTQILFAYLCFRAIKSKNRLGLANALLIVTCFFVLIIRSSNSLKEVANIFLPEPGHNYSRYRFLNRFIPVNSVIIADSVSNILIPAYGPKVISTAYPLYWVADIEERRADAHSFFLTTTSFKLRQEIIKKYGAAYILIDERSKELDSVTVSALSTMGQAVYEKDHIKLVKCE